MFVRTIILQGKLLLRIARQPSDGYLIIGGTFSSVDGITRNNIARVKPFNY